MTMQYGCSNSFQAASPGRAACGLTSCLQGTIPIHPQGSLIEIRCALLKREVQGKHCCIFVACLVASKTEPRTFGLGFVLVFFLFIYLFFYLIILVPACWFLLSLLLEIQFLSPVFSWKILWMGGELIGLGYQRSQQIDSLTNHKQTFLCKMRQLLKGYQKMHFTNLTNVLASFCIAGGADCLGNLLHSPPKNAEASAQPIHTLRCTHRE